MSNGESVETTDLRAPEEWERVLQDAANDPERFERLLTQFIADRYLDLLDAGLPRPEIAQILRQELADILGADIPDPVELEEKLSAFNLGLALPQKDPPQQGVRNDADPVMTFNGQFVESVTDVRLHGTGMSLAFQRHYKNQARYLGPLGFNWTHNYNLWLRVSGDTIFRSTADLREDAYRHHPKFGDPGFNYWTPPNGQHGVILGSGASFIWRDQDGLEYRYAQHSSLPFIHLIDRIVDTFGNFLGFSYDDQDRLIRIEVNHAARFLVLDYDDLNRIRALTDHTGRNWRYCYDDLGDLVRVTGPETEDFPLGLTRHYGYSSSEHSGALAHSITSITDPEGQDYLENVYGTVPGHLSFNRVTSQRLGAGETHFQYADVDDMHAEDYAVKNRPAHETVVTHRNGHIVRHLFNASGNELMTDECLFEEGVLKRIRWRYRYNPDGGLTSSLSPEGVLVQMVYGRDLFAHSAGLDSNDDNAISAAATANDRRGFGRLMAHVERGESLDFAPLDLSAGAFADIFPNPLDGLGPEDIVVKRTYEPQNGRLLSVSDPRFTRSAPPNAPDEDPRHTETLTVFRYDGPPEQPFRHLVAIQSPAATAADGTVSPPSEDRFIRSDGSPAYDARGRLLESENAAGRRAGFTYRPDQAADPQSGHMSRAIADVGGLMATTEFERDELGRVVAMTLPRAAEATDGRFIERAKYNALDQLVETTGSAPFELKVRRQFDGNGMLVLEERDLTAPDGAPIQGGLQVRTYCYDAELNLLEESIGGAHRDGHLAIRHRYDASGRRCLTELPRGNRIAYDYDARGLLIAETAGDGSPDAATTRTLHDLDGRAIRAINPRGNATSWRLDPFGRVVQETDGLGNISLVSYDKASNIICTRQFERRESGYFLLARTEADFDERNRLIRSGVSLFDVPLGPIDEASIETAFLAAPGAGRLLVTEWHYDARDRQVRAVDPSGREVRFVYDALDRVMHSEDASGTERDFRYDLHGNLIREDISDPEPDPVNPGDIGARHFFASAFQYDELNRQVAAIDSLGNRSTVAYDSRGLPG